VSLQGYMFANLNWKDLAELRKRDKFVLLLPIGSTESHGPHAPCATDVLISLEVCRVAARKLQGRQFEAWVLPAVSYVVTEAARHFPGTISISPDVDSRMVSDICASLIKQDMPRICIFNSHFEPTHIRCIYDAIERVEQESEVKVLFTDVTRKKYSARLPEAYRKAETHADRYETSLILAIDPSLVNEERRRSLPYLPMNLAEKHFTECLDNFLDFGMDKAYCGDPAAASQEEGDALLDQLSDFVVEDIEKFFSGAGQVQERGLYGRKK
jgi:creatinine amidohydrolase